MNYVLVEWPDSQEFVDKEGVRLSDESSYFVPIDVYKRVMAEKEQRIVTSELTLTDHAESWYKEQGRAVPDRGTPEWQTMYAEWVDFAFST